MLDIWHAQSVTRIPNSSFMSQGLVTKVGNEMGRRALIQLLGKEAESEQMGPSHIEDKRERRTERGDSCLSYARPHSNI